MLLRNSISTTKKFFHKTIQSFKSFFSGDSYERIPKSSPYRCAKVPFGTDMNDVNTGLDKFYSDFTDRWDTSDDHKAKAKKKDKIKITPPKQVKDADQNNGSFLNDYQIQKREKLINYNKNHNSKRSKENLNSISRRDQERRSFLVAQKLREIEMMDIDNVDHVLDVEEVLHYYSRLRCPAYLDIVDKFFMDMYAELFGPPVNATPPSVSSRTVIRLSS